MCNYSYVLTDDGCLHLGWSVNAAVITTAILGFYCRDQITYEGQTQNLEPGTVNPYPTAFPYGNGMVLHFYQQQESSTTKTVHKVINKGLKTYV